MAFRLRVLAILQLCAATLAAGQAPTLARELQRAARDLETVDCRRTTAISLLPRYGTPDPKPDPATVARDRAIERVRAVVERRLREHPDDAAAWVLSARLGYVVGGCGDWAGSLGPDDSTYEWTAPPLEVAPLHAALDRALQLHPGYAAAHYWKAILYHVSQPVVRGRELEDFKDLDRTIEHARRATTLEPSNAVYRLLWGSVLVEAGRFNEAMPVLQPLDRGRHLLYRILGDFAALPLPPGTVAWPRTAADTAAMPFWAGHAVGRALMMSSHIERNPEAELTHEQPLGRVRSWMVPLTIAEVETHFRGVWPGFRFFAGDSTRVPRDSAAYAADSATRLNPFALPAFKVMQQLRVDSGGTMVPLDSVPLAGPGPTDGLLLLASDGPRTDAAPPVAGMRAQTLLIVLNYRRAR